MDGSGQVTQSSFDPVTGPVAKAPAAAGKYWDGLSNTDSAGQAAYISAPPNPQIAAGPDDILTVVNRTIARYPNPNAVGNAGAANPFSYPPTHKAFLDAWIGLNGGFAGLCPAGPQASTCVLDNVSIRFDQMQGRFLVLMTVTDLQYHVSNWVLLVSRWANFACSLGGPTVGCPFTGDVFSPPAKPGGAVGNWLEYTIPINVVVPYTGAGGAGVPFCTSSAGCTNYYPTDARFGLDNDNIVLTAPVLDQAQTPSASLPGGRFAGTRVTTLPKLIVYNGTALPLGGGGAVNLADSPATGTLTGTAGSSIPPIFWEPDNLRGRTLASYGSQVSVGLPADGATDTRQGLLAPISFLVGSEVSGTPGGVGSQSKYYVQPIVYSCPGSAIYSAGAGVSYCGTAGGVGTQVPLVPSLGVRTTTASLPRTALSLSTLGDAQLVGQQASRLFVGDSRPQQVIFRDGLLHVSRTAQVFESGSSAGASTVVYDLIKQRAPACDTNGAAGTGAPGPFCAAFGSPYSSTGVTIPNPLTVLETYWYDASGAGFYAPMYDAPAGLISLASNNQPLSTLSLAPWLERLFVGMTRPGDAAYGTPSASLDPVTGAHTTSVALSTRGGASTDPNDGSLWLYGAFAKTPTQWGTSVSNYALNVTSSSSDNQYFADVQPGTNGFFTWIQIARTVGIAVPKAIAGCPATAGNPPVLPPPTGTGSGGTTTPGPQVCNTFGPTDIVNRAEMSRWVVLAQMDEAQVTAYLNATGGLPGCADLKALGQTCANNATGTTRGSTFADPGIFDSPYLRYIETMYRRGYTKGCPSTADVTRKFCPNDPVTRGQMAVFIIRAKMNNVFPTSLSGIPLNGIYGDNFGTFLGINGGFATGQYFEDEPPTDGFFPFIQKMRELRITNGTGVNADPAHPCPTGPCYSPMLPITRQEVATFIVRAFFL